MGVLALFWNDNYELQVLSYSTNYIHVAAKERRSCFMFKMTFIYGNPIVMERKDLWPKLLKLKALHEGPWCCISDFNDMVDSGEKDRLRPVELGRI